MDDFEKRLKSLQSAKPPEDLELQIFGPEPELFSFRNLFRRPVRLGWAAGFSMAMGVTGFMLALAIVRVDHTEDPVRNTEVVVRIVERTSDMTEFVEVEQPVGHFLSNASVTIEKREEL